ncbi:MAG: thiamine biosynthesis protein ThiS [Parasphingorhabdus sp.]
MKIRLKLSGELEDGMRPELAASYSVAEGSNVHDVLEKLPFKDRVALTSVNGKMVPPAQRPNVVISDGDELMLLPAIKGG